MAMRNERTGQNSTQSNPNSQKKTENPMKSVQTKPLPTKMVFLSEQEVKKGDNQSSKK